MGDAFDFKIPFTTIERKLRHFSCYVSKMSRKVGNLKNASIIFILSLTFASFLFFINLRNTTKNLTSGLRARLKLH